MQISNDIRPTWLVQADSFTIQLNNATFPTTKDYILPFQCIQAAISILNAKYLALRDHSTLAKDKTRKWAEYRLEDCIEVCSQETERVIQCLSSIPQEKLFSDRPLMELEQQFGIWTPYDSDDDSDDDDYEEEEEDSQKDSLCQMSESDIEIIE